VGTQGSIQAGPPAPTAPLNTGAGAAPEDANSPTTSSVNASLNSSAATNPITPKPNVLDQYASYTYSLSLYLITPKQFNELQGVQPNFNSWLLLLQSGGTQNNPSPSSNPTSGRSPFFNLDYYMDNLVLESKPVGGNNLAHNVSNISFTVVEPSGITFPNAMAQAVQNLYKQNNIVGKDGTTPAYLAADYVMVVRFYGYNDAGELVQAGTTNANGAGSGNQQGAAGFSQGAVITKYYPFNITKFEFRLANRSLEYLIRGRPHGYYLGASAMRGSVPVQLNLVGKTVQDILAGTGSTGTRVTQTDGRQNTKSVPEGPPSPAQQILDNKSATGLVSPDGMDFTAGNY
jgi:hypothetical protein